jgi:amino acid transporter
VSIIYSYEGYANAFNMVNEVKNPIRTIKRSAYSCTAIIFVLYFLVNIAYFAGVPKADLKTSSQTTASLFFANVFGDKAAQGLTILPVISALGNILAVIVGQARMVREIGRQGVLPYPKFWVTTRPFGSPVGSVLVIWGLTVIMILAPPAGSAFNFIVSLKSWPDSVFLGLVAVGLLRLRRQRAKAGLPRSEYRGWTWVVILFILSKIYLIIMPWVPPKGTTTSPSFGFFYATPAIVALGVVLIMVVYYWAWTRWLPKLGHYKLRANVLEHEDGSVGTRFVKVPEDEVEAWDAKHDPAGRSLDERVGGV